MRIETERLIIRSIQKGDEKLLADMAKDGSFSELGFDADCSEWIDEWINEAIKLSEADDPRADYICSIICLKDDERVIGTVGNTYYEDTGKIGICYGIGAEYRQHGLATEAVRAYLEYFFQHYDEKEIIATILDENIASCKTAEKAGFKLLDTRMYKDIYDEEERLYHFYSASK
ncbi:MAG: GNAT family N-acetyltransferase [Butyrivibrio sp.]|uniref:GNAT family N-acetyltransferase n=1 Tax=Butyrivibrio sp. TaxID=28121 RepID=UPI0025C4C7B1|nr:GNAT family N-acetyltransferase [Butyrivibrio sp.]MBQ6589424.1 GNAT family N-acetyltransferase [Butyrivibrio sp.]